MTTMEYPQYNDPFLIIWRAGTADDPYIDKTDTLKIVNNQIVLSEIPDEFNHVTISGYAEVYNTPPTSTQFVVNYRNGIVTFNPSEEGKTVTATYKGRGVIMYPAERIYVHSDNPDMTQNIQQMIDGGRQAIQVYTNIGNAINTANTVKGQLETDINTGNKLHTNLTNNISSGNSLHTTLTNDINSGNTLKSNLESDISTGNSLHTTLKNDINSGNTLHTTLTNDINTGNTLNTTLTSDINTGNTLHTTLTNDINSGNTLKTTLKSDINTGNTLHTTLTNDISSGNALKTTLETDISNGNTLHTTLTNDISTGNSLHTTLTNNITTGNTLKTTLETDINTGNTLHTTLNTDINNANITKTNLENTISIANGTINSLNSKILDIPFPTTSTVTKDSQGRIINITDIRTDLNVISNTIDYSNFNANNMPQQIDEKEYDEFTKGVYFLRHTVTYDTDNITVLSDSSQLIGYDSIPLSITRSGLAVNPLSALNGTSLSTFNNNTIVSFSYGTQDELANDISLIEIHGSNVYKTYKTGTVVTVSN